MAAFGCWLSQPSAGLTTIAGLSKEKPLPLSPALAPLIQGLSSRPLPRDLPPGVVRGEAAVLLVSTFDCSSVKKGCLLGPVTRGEELSGMPLLLAGLDCLHEQVRERGATLQIDMLVP